MEKKPGWDAKAIALIAREHYGTYAKMFEEHDWPETGSGLMRSVQTRVVEKYGSVEKKNFFVSIRSTSGQPRTVHIIPTKRLTESPVGMQKLFLLLRRSISVLSQACLRPTAGKKEVHP